MRSLSLALSLSIPFSTFGLDPIASERGKVRRMGWGEISSSFSLPTSASNPNRNLQGGISKRQQPGPRMANIINVLREQDVTAMRMRGLYWRV